MVNGIDKFINYFKEYTNQYVLIGGTACDVILRAKGIDFRRTVDLDVVLIIEALTTEFGKAFFQFIREGGYENRCKSNGSPQFYRFDKPKNPYFPAMIELLSRAEGILIDKDQVCGPIHISDEIYSLPAILLNDAYYEMLLNGRKLIDGLSVVDELYLIPLKAKAYLDLTNRKSNGENVKSEDIKKHRKDIIRLALTILPETRCELINEVKIDMKQYIDNFKREPIEPAIIGYTGISVEDISEVLENTYLD